MKEMDTNNAEGSKPIELSQQRSSKELEYCCPTQCDHRDQSGQHTASPSKQRIALQEEGFWGLDMSEAYFDEMSTIG